MKKLTKAFVVAAAIVSTGILSSCALPFPVGCVYTRVTEPVSVGNGDISYRKIGKADCISVLGVFANGDASINEACRQGGIRKVSWVNREAKNILGVYGTYTTVVYGYGEEGLSR